MLNRPTTWMEGCLSVAFLPLKEREEALHMNEDVEIILLCDVILSYAILNWARGTGMQGELAQCHQLWDFVESLASLASLGCMIQDVA